MPQKKPLSREAARRKRLRIQKRRRRRITLVVVCCLVLLIAIVSAIHAIGTRLSDATEPENPPSSAQDTAKTPEKEEKEEEKVYEPASVSLIAVGDNLIHNTLLKDASNGDGTYDFTSFYENVKPYVEAADIAFVNQESPLGTGEPAGYPSFNTPQSCG